MRRAYVDEFPPAEDPVLFQPEGVESQRFVLPARVCRVGPVHFVGFVVEADEEGRRHNDIRFQTFVEVLLQQILIPGDEVFSEFHLIGIPVPFGPGRNVDRRPVLVSVSLEYGVRRQTVVSCAGLGRHRTVPNIHRGSEPGFLDELQRVYDLFVLFGFRIEQLSVGRMEFVGIRFLGEFLELFGCVFPLLAVKVDFAEHRRRGAARYAAVVGRRTDRGQQRSRSLEVFPCEIPDFVRRRLCQPVYRVGVHRAVQQDDIPVELPEDEVGETPEEAGLAQQLVAEFGRQLRVPVQIGDRLVGGADQGVIIRIEHTGQSVVDSQLAGFHRIGPEIFISVGSPAGKAIAVSLDGIAVVGDCIESVDCVFGIGVRGPYLRGGHCIVRVAVEEVVASAGTEKSRTYDQKSLYFPFHGSLEFDVKTQRYGFGQRVGDVAAHFRVESGIGGEGEIILQIDIQAQPFHANLAGPALRQGVS